MKITTCFLQFILLTFSLSATGFEAVNDKIEKTKNGISVNWIRKNTSAPIAKVSDIAELNLSYFTKGKDKKDSLIFDSQNSPQKAILVPLKESAFKGDIMEVLTLMHVGDSAIFNLPADSFFFKTVGVKELPKGITKGSELYFFVGMKDFKTEEQMRAMQAQLEEQEKIKGQENQMKEGTLIKEYLTKNGITQTPTASGLIIITKTKGNGVKPKVGQKVSVHYTGTLLDGTKFDSSLDRGEPIQFTLGQGQVIKGWDEGIAELEIGGSATLVIPSSIAYGPRGSGPIGPYSPLVFEVQLINAE
jgi:FKBP-type peptidyl-prolyl cis-trans isomerase FkpA